MLDARKHLGRRAERAAERLLRRQGLVILARNWRANGGEIDLAALDGDTLVFVEVKSRSGDFLPDRAPVSVAQRRRIAGAARAFRARFGVEHLPFRFDLVTATGAGADLAWSRNYQEKR